MQDAGSGYHISAAGDLLVFRTERYTTGKGSVLHSGIYNREFASALTAFGVSGIVYLGLALRYGKTLPVNAAAFAVFVAGFVLLRVLVFKERYLTAEFDRQAGTVRITMPGVRGRVETLRLQAVERLRIDREKVGVENPDGADFVKRISAQHGTVIPGFGEEEVFYALRLVLRDGTTRTLYADRGEAPALAAYEEINGFLGIQ